MNRTPAVSLLTSLFLSGCGSHVPVVDPENIVVDGRQMAPDAFIQKYCLSHNDNETCIRVRVVASKQFTRARKKVEW